MPNISKKNEAKIINTKGVKELITNSASFNKILTLKKLKMKNLCQEWNVILY